jgi:hypothetical protein
MADDKTTPATPAAQEDQSFLAEVVGLLRDHPRWAIWLPAYSGVWTAVRPASSRPPGPDVPLLWAHASTAAQLAGKLRALDEQVSADGWP